MSASEMLIARHDIFVWPVGISTDSADAGETCIAEAADVVCRRLIYTAVGECAVGTSFGESDDTFSANILASAVEGLSVCVNLWRGKRCAVQAMRGCETDVEDVDGGSYIAREKRTIRRR